MQLRLAIDVEIPDEETDATGMSIEFIEWNHRAVALLTEIGELFRAAIHLTYHCEYPIIPTLANKPQGGGLLCVAAEGRMKFHKWDIAVHTYPAIFLGEYLGEFESFLSDLSTKWHLPLWPIHRFLKALGAEHVEMENLLDLLYALEGLFPTNTSSEFIRVAVALLLSNDRKNAFQANEALQKAFQYRNSIVHGAEAMTGMETITLHGKETLSQRLFPAIQRITAGMIRVAFGKLQRLQDMRVLRISVQDVLEHVFP